MKKVFTIEVDCAICAKKCEEAIAKLDGVNECSINFITQKMVFDADTARFDELLKLAKKTARKIEPDFDIEA